MNLGGTPSLFKGNSLQKKRNFKQLSLPGSSPLGQYADEGQINNAVTVDEPGSSGFPHLRVNLTPVQRNDGGHLQIRRGFKGKLELEKNAVVEANQEIGLRSNVGIEMERQTFVVSSPTNSSPSTSTSLTHVFTPMDDDLKYSQSAKNSGNGDNGLTHSSLFQNGETHSIENSIKLEDLVQLGKIGSGNSGTVIKALYVPESKIIAKKVIPVENNNSLVVNQLVRELTIMKSVHSHGNIVSFYGAYYSQSTGNEIIILMEYMNCGSLDKILSVYKRFYERRMIRADDIWFNELVISKISFAVLSGLSYLYEKYKIIHRDIKPSNVLINSKGQVKICDFGVSKKLINSIADTFVGTSTYMSLERIQGNVYSTKGDVWSLGLMIIELVTAEFPLGGHNDTPNGILDLLQRIVNEPSPSLPTGGDYCFSVEMIDFVNRCCVKNERERSSINELLCHDFISVHKKQGKEFRHWCKKVKVNLKEDKQIRREENERAKLEKTQLEKAAHAAAARRC